MYNLPNLCHHKLYIKHPRNAELAHPRKRLATMLEIKPLKSMVTVLNLKHHCTLAIRIADH